MSGNSARLAAISSVADFREPGYVEPGDVTKIFGSNVFSDCYKDSFNSTSSVFIVTRYKNIIW